MTEYREPDLSRVRTVSLTERANKVDPSLLAAPPAEDRSFSAFLRSLPQQLAASSLLALTDAIVTGTRARGRTCMLLVGGHVVKTGLGPLFVEWIRRGVVSHVALNGAAAIHDYELAAYGGTSEDVEAGLADGTFGMAEETGRDMNSAAITAASEDRGLGEGLARHLASRSSLAHREASLLLAAHDHKVPITVHAAIGADIIHQHPSVDGAALGATTYRDFRRLAGSMPALHQGGVVLNLGSAVILPEVFLKALTVCRNVEGGRPTGLIAADFDMVRHYRPRVNVVERPTRAAGGRGFLFTGHHELLLPLLVWAVVEGLEGR